MPRYDYECEGCGWSGEEFQKMDDRHKMACPTCGRPATLVLKPQPRYVPFNEYFDIGLGADVTSWAHRRRLMREGSLDHRDPISKGDISAFRDKQQERKRRKSERHP